MRLIDADALKFDTVSVMCGDEIVRGYDCVDADTIKNAPTVTVVPAPVKCGECKFYDTDECAMVEYCDGCDCKVDLQFDETGYCSAGKQKDGDPHV